MVFRVSLHPFYKGNMDSGRGFLIPAGMFSLLSVVKVWEATVSRGGPGVDKGQMFPLNTHRHSMGGAVGSLWNHAARYPVWLDTTPTR